jgi:CRP-like cAMP-binding protein
MSLFGDEHPVLDTLDARDRDALLALGSPRTYPDGAALVREGERTTFVVAILAGWSVVSTATDRGGRLILALRGAGDVIGDLAAIDERPRSATVTALGEIRAVVIAGERFRGFLFSRPGAARVIMRQIGARLRDADSGRRELASSTVLERLAALLTELADRRGRDTEGGVTIDLALPQHDLAASVGATREAVAKGLRVLRDRGIVRTGQRKLVVIHPDLLRLLTRPAPEA